MTSPYEISVEASDTDTYRVTLGEGASRTYLVDVSAEEVASLGGGASAEELIEESFRFLLEREGPGSIQSSFQLPHIAKYFPEYPEEIRLRLQGTVG